MASWLARLATGLGCLLLASCATNNPTVESADDVEPVSIGLASQNTRVVIEAPPAPVLERWQWQHPHYQQLAEEALLSDGTSLIFSEPADVSDYCPAWPQLDGYQRLGFWADLLAAMAVHESRHNPAARHTERFADRFGKPVVSRGLLQLSQESANGYGCGISQAEQLHNPAENIRCAVRIMTRWVNEDGVISGFTGAKSKPWRGGARYWSVLRANAKTADIQANLRGSSHCLLPNKSSTVARRVVE